MINEDKTRRCQTLNVQANCIYSSSNSNSAVGRKM